MQPSDQWSIRLSWPLPASISGLKFFFIIFMFNRGGIFKINCIYNGFDRHYKDFCGLSDLEPFLWLYYEILGIRRDIYSEKGFQLNRSFNN